MEIEQMRSRKDPVDILRRFLENPAHPETVHELVAEDAVHLSINDQNPELEKVLPWTGRNHGPQGFLDAHSRMFHYIRNEEFIVETIFGSGGNVAAFGTVKQCSNTLSKSTCSPFSVWAKVAAGKIVFLQYLEDSYATALSFKSEGFWTVHADTEGKPYDVR